MEAANDEHIRHARLFDVKHSDGTDGTLTIAPGAIAVEVRKRSEKNDRKNIIFQCSEIKKVESGKSAFQPPHVNFYLVPVDGKERKISYFTSSGGQGLFVNKPIVDVTADVVNATIRACRTASDSTVAPGKTRRFRLISCVSSIVLMQPRKRSTNNTNNTKQAE